MGLYLAVTLASYVLAAWVARKFTSLIRGVVAGAAIGAGSLFVTSILLGFFGYIVSFDQMLYWFSSKILGVV